MKLRKVIIFNGKSFRVPQCIQRIDTRSTHGWQVRYGGTKMFSDGSPDGSGAKAALAAATLELVRRIAEHPAPVKLQRGPSATKSTNLPAGISGPIVQQASDTRGRSASLSVLIPRYGQKSLVRKVYIGTELTYTPARYRAALKRALVLRRAAEEVYKLDATKARRREAVELKRSLRG